jgi:hypothetical protein
VLLPDAPERVRAPKRTKTLPQVRLQILREDRDADGKVVDGAGFQFFSTIARAPLNTCPNPEQMPAKPVERLEKWTRVELDLSDVVGCRAHAQCRHAAVRAEETARLWRHLPPAASGTPCSQTLPRRAMQTNPLLCCASRFFSHHFWVSQGSEETIPQELGSLTRAELGSITAPTNSRAVTCALHAYLCENLNKHLDSAHPPVILV